MKFFTLGACVAFAAAGTVSVRDGETPHDPEAMAFCQGREDGYYSNPKDCGSYFFCWNNGKYVTFEVGDLIASKEIRQRDGIQRDPP